MTRKRKKANYWWSGLALVWILLPGLSLSSAVFSQAQSTTSIDDLQHLFRIDAPTADIALLLDASLSMVNHHYDQARQAVVDFVPTLTAKENLHLRVFGDVVSSPLEGTGNELASRIGGYLPERPLFKHTDLGLAIEKGLEFLERDGSSPLQALFIMTDGLHDPPPGSLYSRDFDDDPDWKDLQRRAHAICETRTVFVYGFGLGDQTDIALLRRIFPTHNVEIIVGGADQVGPVLQNVRERLGHTELRQAITREFKEGKVEAITETKGQPESRQFRVSVVIRNSYAHLPIRLGQIRIDVTGPAQKEITCGLVEDPVNVILPVERKQDWRGEIDCSVIAGRPWHLGRVEQHYESKIRAVPIAHFTNEAALKDLEVGPALPNIDAQGLTIGFRLSYGLSYWWIICPLSFCLLLFAGRRIAEAKQKQEMAEIDQIRLRRSRVTGSVKIWNRETSEPAHSCLDLSDPQSNELALVTNGQGELKVISSAESGDQIPVARFIGNMEAKSIIEARTKTPEFLIEPGNGHTLACETGGRMASASSTLVLCDGDLLLLDDWWLLRYSNPNLATRATVESAY